MSARPLYPVNPFSNIRGTSSGAMPIPVSAISSSFSGVTVMVTLPCWVYFTALDRICSMMKSSHFSSVSTFTSVGSYSSLIRLLMNCGAYLRMACLTMPSSSYSRNRKSVESLPRRIQFRAISTYCSTRNSSARSSLCSSVSSPCSVMRMTEMGVLIWCTHVV